ncbi:MAG: methyltransferase domain-containing protein [Candidatus Woesearchaeota archaeon]
MGIKMMAMTRGGETYPITDTGRDFHTRHGFISRKDLDKEGVVKTNTGKEMFIFKPLFADAYKRIKRHAQIITPKDLGLIITTTGVNKSSFVVDIGSGSGALACFIGVIAKNVVTYDIDDRSIRTTKENAESLGLKNVKVRKKDATEGIDEKDADVVTIDMREPWKALDSAIAALKQGGFIAVYSPNITQVIRTIEEAGKKDGRLAVIRTTELMQRDWVIDEKRARPEFRSLGHTGFLCFMRKV